MNTKSCLYPEERLDDLQRNGYKIIQNPNKFCFGIDAVLLSGFADIKKGSRVLDLGTGTGILPILLAAKTEAKSFEGLEIQEESADMARRSIAYNGLQELIHITTGNIAEASSLFGCSSFDAVVTNPPYMNDKHGLKNPDMPKAIARHEVLCSLEDVIRESSRVLQPKKSLFMVHRPFRLAEIFQALTKYHLEPKRMRLVHPYLNKEPNMVLIEAVKDGNPMLKIEPPLIVYKSPGVYTDEILELYRF
ncbi:tRNA1(Val) (adenine(37)-N6)-methyltransferase [bacterium D16-51]|nr:tRNA1(Val) (adenine(37)-N6)-methyltransferase [bacterium D16-59]RKI60380.1 tRNA1(Val) (adenine(37)-N6)-methyltransferase [bacterium D16-51]